MLSLRSTGLSPQLKIAYSSHLSRSRKFLHATVRRNARRAPKEQADGRPDDNDEQLQVNYFEQNDDSTSERRRVEGPEGQEDVADLKARIAALEKEIQSFKLPKQMPENMARKLLSDRQRQRTTTDFEDELAELGLGRHQIKSAQTLSRTGRIYLDKLNECLDTASLSPEDADTRKTLWKWYERSKSNISELLAIIPQEGWDLLWRTQAIQSSSNPDRASHLAVLAEDMLRAGRALSEEQRYSQVEAHFVLGRPDTAFSLWEASGLHGTHVTPEYLEMGVRMYAHQGDVTRAEELLNRLFETSQAWDPRIIHSVMAAYTKSETKGSEERAWALYLRMREMLGTNMTLKDYDIVTLGFLHAKYKDLALAVFRDMMLSGDAVAAEDSASLYKKALTRMGQLFSLTKDADELNKVSLNALMYLPRRYQNKFFYASWLKRLIGMNQLDAAAQVIELMYERGVAPDAKHMNGLISAWLREGGTHARRQAESLAWSMIQKRIDFVHARRVRKDPSLKRKTPNVYIIRPGLEIPTFVDRPVPLATSETFSIMVAHYLRQEMFENVRHLRDMIADCEIPISSYFMNHLLYAELRNRGYRHVWARFQVMTKTAKPDVETFICLWECMKFHVDKTRNTDPTGFPSPQQLFAVMAQWISGLRGQERSDAIGDLDLDTYHDIIRCFCLINSLEGAFVVMHTVKSSFHLYPTMKTVRMLMMQVARIHTPKLRRPSSAKGGRNKDLQEQSLARTTEILEILTNQRRSQLREKGVEFASLDQNQQSEELHRSLMMLLYTMASRRQGNSTTENNIRHLTEQMGLQQFDANEAMAVVV